MFTKKANRVVLKLCAQNEHNRKKGPEKTKVDLWDKHGFPRTWPPREAESRMKCYPLWQLTAFDNKQGPAAAVV